MRPSRVNERNMGRSADQQTFYEESNDYLREEGNDYRHKKANLEDWDCPKRERITYSFGAETIKELGRI